MSMTESEALEVFNSGCNDIYKVQVATHTAIKALEEVQQLHAIGTVSEFAELKEKKYDCDIKHLFGECSYAETGCSDCIGKLKIKEALEKATERYFKEDAPDGYGHTCTNKTCAERIRTKAIEEFAEALKEKYPHFVEDVGFVEGNKMLHINIDKIAKELKGE